MQLTTLQNWDGGSMPSGWTVDAALTQSAAAAVTGTQSLCLPVNVGVSTAYYSTLDANGGNVIASHFARIDGPQAGAEQDVNVFVRGSSPSPFSGSTEYAAQLSINNQSGSPGLSLVKRVAGAQTVLANPGGTFAAATWYYVEIGAIGTALTVAVQRATDGQWLTPAGAWQSGYAVAISVADGSITGAGYAGIVMYAGTNAGPNYSDAFALRTAAAAPAAATLLSPAFAIAYANHRSTPITVRGTGVTANTTVTLSDGGAGGVWQDGSFNEITSVTLTAAAPTAVVYYRPPFAAAGPINLSASSGGTLDDGQAFATCLIRPYPTLATPDPTQLSWDQVAVRRPSNLWAPFPRDLSGPFTTTPAAAGQVKFHDVAGGTEAVSAGNYTRTNGSAENEVWYHAAAPLPNPGYNVALTVSAWGGGTTDQALCGAAVNDQNYVAIVADNHAGTVALVKCAGGTKTTLATQTVSLPAGSQLLCQVAKEWAVAWYKRPTDAGYQYVGLGQVSTNPTDAFAWQTIATLTTFYPFWGTNQAAATAVSVTGFTLGHAGALAFQNCRYVKDETTGAPLLSADGSTAYITSNGGMNSSVPSTIDSAWLTDVFALDRSTLKLTHVSRLWFARNNRMAADLPAAIGYNPASQTWTVLSSDWPDFAINGTVDLYYTQTTENILSGVAYLAPQPIKLPNSVAAGSTAPLSHYDADYELVGATYHIGYVETQSRANWAGVFYTCHATGSTIGGTFALAWSASGNPNNEGAVLAHTGGTMYQLTGSGPGMNVFNASTGALIGALTNYTGGGSTTTFVPAEQVAPHPCLLSLPGETTGTTRYVLIAFDSAGLNPDGLGAERWTWGNAMVFEAIERRSASEFVAWTSPPGVPAAAVAPPGTPPLCTCTLTTLTAQGTIDPSVAVQFLVLSGPGIAGFGYFAPLTVTSNALGALSVNLPQGARVQMSWGQGPPVTFTVPNTASALLAELLGQ